jgi:hypothetical protein
VIDEGFEDIVVDRSGGGRVVGIRVYTSTGEAGRGVVLVDERGKLLCGDDACANVTVRMTDASSNPPAGLSSSSSSQSSGRRRGGDDGSSAIDAAVNSLSDANSELLVRYGLMAFGALLVLKILLKALTNALALLALPVAYVYATMNRPPNDTFDAKRELKRTMRGAHLPEESRPKGFLERSLNRLAASVTTELATSLGYGVSLTDCLGAATLACVTVPCNGLEYYWIGIFGECCYVSTWSSQRFLCNRTQFFENYADCMLKGGGGLWVRERYPEVELTEIIIHVVMYSIFSLL